MNELLIPSPDAIPVNWIWFQVLLVITFVIHLVLMNFILGGSLLTLWDMYGACHGSTHAVYGAENKYELQRDNLQPLQYQGIADTIGTYGSCAVCHVNEMEFNGHQRNMVNREDNVAIVN